VCLLGGVMGVLPHQAHRNPPEDTSIFKTTPPFLFGVTQNGLSKKEIHI